MSSKRFSVLTIAAAILAVGCLWAAGPVQAGTIYFDATNGDYATAANWSGDSLPVAADTAYIGYNLFTPATATINSDLSGTNVTALRIGIEGTGDLTINSGGGLSYSWFVIADKTSSASTTAGTGTFTQNAGTLNVSTSVNGGWYIGNLADCVGTHTMNGGTLTLGSGGTKADVYIGHYGSGTVNMHGGTISQVYTTSTFNVALVPGSTGIFNQDGGNVSVRQLYISQGSGTQQGGNGTVTISDDAVFTANSTVSIGNKTGTGKFEAQGSLASIEWKTTATLGANSTLSFVADSNGVSDILLSGTGTSLTIVSGAQLSLNLSALGTAANDLVLVDNRGTDLISGTFSGFGEGYQFNMGDGSYYALTYVYDASADLANNDLALVAHPVPEPTTLALLACGLLGLLAYAWRKRK
ncbi:MAG: PEP-CTERM sorting domain-containing protein [Pirellulales bacterium]|nr:PEP-CTERM sorting domain-containing protein [Pirellulales bacterium]